MSSHSSPLLHEHARAALREWGWVGGDGTVPELQRMPGGASTREFFRIEHERTSAVLMMVPAPDANIREARQAAGHRPFLEVAALLDDRGIDTPRILAVSDEHHAILVEDLGDTTLEKYLLDHPEQTKRIYQRAVRDLAQAQVSLLDLPPETSVRSRRFDAPLLRWELDHFREWGPVGRGVHLSAQDEHDFAECADHLSSTIASWPTIFVHRDFQSRNLMVKKEASEERLIWIDFQDAMLGPRVYDLVALLTDSYQSLDETFVLERLDEYCRLRNFSLEEIVQEFSLVTIQRKLKDAGRFVYFSQENGDNSYLRFVEKTLLTVEKALARLHPKEPSRALANIVERCLRA